MSFLLFLLQAKLWDRIDSKMVSYCLCCYIGGGGCVVCVSVWGSYCIELTYRTTTLPCYGSCGTYTRAFICLTLCTVLLLLLLQEDRVKALKAAGVIACEDEEELADRYMLPAKRRWAALLELLQFLVSRRTSDVPP